MQFDNSYSRWKQWFRPNRLVPALVILGAGAAIILNLFSPIPLSLAENIIIALLGLLAVDALGERINLIEKIENRLRGLPVGRVLNKRVDIPPVEGYAGHASEICIVGVSAIGLSNNHRSFFESRVRDGCNIRIILLDPDSPSLQTWCLLDKMVTAEMDIKITLINFKDLVLMHDVESTRGTCEIRLLKVFLPYSMFAIDLQKESASILVEYHGYQVTSKERPHVYFTPLDSPYWYNEYRQQFELAWSKATPWIPQSVAV